MPIEHRVDHGRRLVLARGTGVVTDAEIFAYQREVWSRPDVAGYDELVDMSDVERIDSALARRVAELAQLSAGMDVRAPATRFAIVAPRDLEFGLGRMYAAHRELDPRSTKRVEVFRSREEALAWLGCDVEPAP